MAVGDEKVTIRIDVKADTAAIDRVRQKIRQLCREANNCEKTFSDYADAVNDAGDAHVDLDRSSTRTTQSLKRMGQEANGLSKILKTGLKFALIGAGIESVALAVALSSVNGLLATGRFLVKGYNVAMSAMAKTAAGLAVALATVAAAQRQFVAAQSAGRYGGSYAAASQGLRTLQADARLASLGIQTLSGAFAAASKNAKVTGATASAIAGLMDFAVASGDIEKGASAVANLVSLVQKGGAGQAGVLEAAKQLGPEFEKAFKEATRGGRATSAELMKLFSSGELAQRAGLAGGFAATRGTLLGQLKSFMTEMQVMFADLGMQFIEPVQRAFEEIRRIMVRTVTQLMPILSDFATGSMIDKLVNGVDKISQFLVKLMQDYVPRTQGFFESMSRAWDRLTDGFERFNRYLRKFSEASKIINTFFGQIFGAIGSGLKNNFEAFGIMLVENQDEFDKFGKSLANLITQIFNLFNAIREAFMKALPAISAIADAVARIVSSIADLIRMLTNLPIPGGLGGLAGLMLPMFAGLNLRGGRGGRGGGTGGTPGGTGGQQRGRGGGSSRMGAGKQLGIIGGILGVGGLSQIPGVGADIGSMASAGLMGAMFAPAGFAGPAALAAAGLVGTNILADQTYQSGILGTGLGAKNKAVSAGTGAVAGAAIGATVGSMVPIIGTALGAIGGAIVGGVMGWAKDGKYKKQAKEAAGKFVETYASNIETMLAGNDLEAATKAMDQFKASAQQMADGQVKSGTAMDAAMEAWGERSEGLQESLDIMGARFGDLERITGMTTDQIRDLANAAEVDLGNGMLSLQQILEATGVATVRFGEDFNRELTNSYASIVSGIRQTTETLRAPVVINEAAQTLREQALAGTLTSENLGAGLETIMQQQLLLSGGDPLAAFKAFVSDMGAAPGGGAQFNVPGNVFADPAIIAAFQSAGFGDYQRAIVQAGTQDIATLAAENLIGGAAGVGMSLGVSKDQLVSMLSGMGTSELISLAEALRAGPAFTSPGGVQAGGRHGGGLTFEQQIRNLGLGDFLESLKPDKTDEQKTRDSMDAFGRSVTGFGAFKDQFGTAVTEFGGHVDKLATPQDTSTPRRNIVNTLGAHSRFDAMIAGNRTVTSGYRNWGLGSMSSDHAAGRAYDLVGQNLGLYQMAVRANGGYAEFHGGASGRHLHVVPNTNSAIGDTATPNMGGAVITTPSGNSTVVNMTINASPGMDVNALASEVMARLERETKSRQERY